MARGIQVTGVRELQAKLKRNASLDDVKRVVQVNGAELHQKAQRNARVDTGFLRRSIIFQLANSGFTAKVIATADYSPYLEFGTRFMAALPFLGPAFRIQSVNFKNDLKRLVN